MAFRIGSYPAAERKVVFRRNLSLHHASAKVGLPPIAVARLRRPRRRPMPRCGRPPSASRPAVHADGSALSSKTERPFLRKDW